MIRISSDAMREMADRLYRYEGAMQIQQSVNMLRALAAEREQAVVVTDEMVDVAIDAWDDVFDGLSGSNPAMRAAIEAALKEIAK